jgi:hypothetical protein
LDQASSVVRDLPFEWGKPLDLWRKSSFEMHGHLCTMSDKRYAMQVNLCAMQDKCYAMQGQLYAM